MLSEFFLHKQFANKYRYEEDNFIVTSSASVLTQITAEGLTPYATMASTPPRIRGQLRFTAWTIRSACRSYWSCMER